MNGNNGWKAIVVDPPNWYPVDGQDGGGLESRLHPRSPTVHTWLHVLSRSPKGRPSGKCPF